MSKVSGSYKAYRATMENLKPGRGADNISAGLRSCLKREPVIYRQGIPFFYPKSEQEFKDDPYENYDDMVVRQTALHLADDLWNGYPMQAVLDFISEHASMETAANLLEIGGSVGRLLGSLAERWPSTYCWSIDFSYQLLKRTREYWMQRTTIQIDASSRGLSKKVIQGKYLSNMAVGLSKAEDLPFKDGSQDLLVHSFLLDRLDDPLKGMREMHRVLKSGGQMIMVSPLNFLKRKHWSDFYPSEKLIDCIQEIGFEITDVRRDMMIVEPLDVRGNVVVWKCIGMTAGKR